VYVDREQWDKILFTLIGNAINYTMEGWVRCWECADGRSIKVSLHYDGAEVVLTVQDTGPGIPGELN